MKRNTGSRLATGHLSRLLKRNNLLRSTASIKMTRLEAGLDLPTHEPLSANVMMRNAIGFADLANPRGALIAV